MDWIYEFIQIFALFLITLWFFTWLCESRSGSGWLFKLKRQLAARWILTRKKSKMSSDSFDAMYKPIDGIFDNKYDSNIISYFGTDQKNNSIFIKINHRKNKNTELVFFITLEDGRTYELSDHPNIVTSEIGDSTWSAGGLKISILESSRRARIIFNGLMRKGTRKDINHDTDDDIEHVRFNGIFVISTKPYSLKEFWSSELQAESLARNGWKKSRWQQIMEEINLNQVDQYGSLLGQITFENSSVVELFLRGMRHSQQGKCDAAHFERNICIMGLDVLGISFNIILSDIKDGIKSMQFGHVKDPMENLSPIKSLTFDVNQFFGRCQNGFDEYAFEFSAGKRNFEAIIKLNRKTQRVLYGGYPWDSQYTFCNFELKLNDSTGTGIIQIWRPYSGLCPITITPIQRSNKIKKFDDNIQDFILFFEDRRCQNENLVGGKGSSLAELTSIETTKFTVPQGFCVTAHALDSHINHYAHISEAINNFVKVCSGEKSEDIKEHSEKVVNLLENTPVVDSVQKSIIKALEKLEENGQKNKFAVRSSAVGEDSEDTSAAGQNSTFLGIKDTQGLIKYVAHCWASLYAYQSVEYRRQHGLPIKASMGVCVQQMVNPEAAGVMFTRHPITGNPKEILITSNYGLGESVVSALVDPDTIIIQRSRKNALSIKTSTIGKKSQKVIINHEDGGTHQSDLNDEDSSKLSINSDITLKLAEIGVNIDELYNAPRDIEWAVIQDKIFLLQCRPVTALDTWTDFEITHELGSGVPSDSDILTFANVGEVLPMVLTPLTISTIVNGLNLSTEMNVKRQEVLKTYTSHMFIANMRVTLNYMSLFLRFIEDKITMGNKVTEIAVCGHSIISPEIHETGKRRNGGGLKPYDRIKVFIDMLNDLWYSSKTKKSANEIVESCRKLPFVQNPESVTSIEQLYQQLKEIAEDFTRVSGSHSHTSKCSIFSQVLVMSLLTEGSEDLTMDHYSDIAILLGSCRDVVSAQVPLALKEIARAIKDSGLSEEFKNIDLSKAIPWLEEKCPEAYKKVQKFIEMHGHRGIEEFDLITDTWGMKPEKFLATVRTMLNSNIDDKTPNTTELSPRETVAQLKTPNKSSTRWILSMLLPWMRRTVATREETKCLAIEMVHMIRTGYRRLATLLTKIGRLPDKELIFFLTNKEIGELIDKPNPALVRKAVRRRKIRPLLQKYKYKEINYGMLKPVEMPKSNAMSNVGVRIQGTSVCNGIATGRACVALTLEDASEIRSGDILITHATDIGWSPYFPLLAGVVTELGGLISHGAVVAREYGLPCIVSAENATRSFKTGEIVTLNGYAGTIEVVTEADTKE